MSRSPPLLRTFLALPALLVCVAQPAKAQSDGDPAWDGDWSVEGAVGGTLIFGDGEQTLFAADIEFERSDDRFESSTDFDFTYGVTTDSEGVSEVSHRSWRARTGLDFRPEAAVSPFVSGQMEASYQRQIGLQYDAGAGVLMNRGPDRRNRIDFSLQILAERTYSRSEGSELADDDGSLIRWSSELRIRREIWGDLVALDLRNNYRPVFDEFGNFTLRSANSATLDVTEVVGLRFTLRLDYDSRAMDRGADTNLDGRLEASVVAAF